MKIKNLGVDSLAPPERASRSLDERIVRSKATVLNATVELLVERGYGGTTVDEISRRCGVAKTTIYRHWPVRTDLLRDACARIGTPLDRPHTGDLEDDLTSIMKNLAALLRSAKWTSVLPSIIDAAERDPDMAAMYSELQHGYSAVLHEVLSEAVHQGKLPRDTDVSVLIAALVGPLFYRRWFSREAVSDVFAEQIIAQVFSRTVFKK
jgi:AcrR family transcriptional regulator